MNRTQLEHIIRAASRISGDKEIIVIGSQSIHAMAEQLPAIAFQSAEADVYPRNYPDKADLIDGSIGELSDFHLHNGYHAQGVSPTTAILPAGWEDRLVPLMNENTDGACGLCLNVHDLALSKYAANREKDRLFNRALVAYQCLDYRTLKQLLPTMPLPEAQIRAIGFAIDADFQQAPRLSVEDRPEP